MDTEQTSNYELVFQGAADDSPKTLQRIRGVFIADLELPITEVQRILENIPSVIKSAESDTALVTPYKLLKNAGANVLIVRTKINSAEDSEPSPEGSECVQPNDTPKTGETTEPAPDTGESEVAFEFSLDDVDPPSEEPPGEAGPKVYTLDFDESEGLPFQANEPEPQTGAPAPHSDPADNPLRGLLVEDELRSLPGANSPQASDDKDAPLPMTTAVRDHSRDMNIESAVPVIDVEAPVPELEVEAAPDSAGIESAPQHRPEGDKLPEPQSDAAFEFELEGKSVVSAAPAPSPKPAEAAPASREAVIPALAAESAPALDVAAPPEVSSLEPERAEEIQKSSAPDAETPAEGPIFTEEPEEARPPAFKAKRSNLTWFIEYGLPIIVGGIVLGFCNWYFFPEAPPADLEGAVRSQMESAKEAEEARKQAEEDAKAREHALSKPDFLKLASADTDGELLLYFKDNAFTSGSLSYSTPESPERTKEDIVNNIPRKPWIKRIEAKFETIPTAVEGVRTFEAEAFSYIDDNGKQVRSLGKASTKLSGAAPTDELQATLILTNMPEKPDVPFLFERDERGSFRFYIETTLKKVQ